MLTSYYTLTVNVGELKFLTALATTAAQGITQADLTAAELWARDRINLWIVRVAGETRGATIVAEFLNAVAQTDVDPAIRHLAELLAAARILREYEARSFINQGPAAGDPLRRKDWEETLSEAISLAKEIERARKTIKADGTVRRWGMGRGQQGPVVNGPLTNGSHFSDRGTYTDVAGRTFLLPHVPPIEQATE
jgi:hypothetical protein